MEKIKFLFGDKYEVIKHSTSKFNTNYIAILSTFLIISSSWLHIFIEENVYENLNIKLIYDIIWLISFILPMIFFTIKLIKYKEFDIYLTLLSLLIILSYLYLTLN